MTTAYVTLTDAEIAAIHALSQREGKSQEEILREAIELYLVRHENEDRLAALRHGRGIWKDRQDLPDLAELRDEWNRF